MIRCTVPLPVLITVIVLHSDPTLDISHHFVLQNKHVLEQVPWPAAAQGWDNVSPFHFVSIAIPYQGRDIFLMMPVLNHKCWQLPEECFLLSSFFFVKVSCGKYILDASTKWRKNYMLLKAELFSLAKKICEPNCISLMSKLNVLISLYFGMSAFHVTSHIHASIDWYIYICKYNVIKKKEHVLESRFFWC